MSNVDEIKSRLDIVDIIGEYLPLRVAGLSFKTNCPFHSEKTPSFMVSRERQSWHCFGCGEGGDMFSFIMRQEGLEFPDALRLLASKAGVQLRQEPTHVKTEREEVGKALALSVKYWQNQLLENSKADTARQYLKDVRKLSDQSIAEWHLGFALDEWDGLVNYLAGVGYSEEVMVKAGVAVRKASGGGRGVYDRFRNRIMFPIMNAHGQVVGATGRVLPGSSEEAKYVNTPESLLFHKGKVLYGLEKAKTAIRDQNMAVLVEGNVDVITSHAAGVKNVVAASGTALTDEQISLIKRFANTVAFAFDQDLAGDKAMKRGLLTALDAGLNVKLIDLPLSPTGEKYKDPDELIQANPEAWLSAVKVAAPILDYFLERAKRTRDLTNLEEKKLVVAELLPILNHMSDPVSVAHYLKRLSETIDVPEDSLRQVYKTSITKDRPVASLKNPQNTPKVRSLWYNVCLQLLAGLVSAPEHASYVFDNVTVSQITPEWQPLYKLLMVDYTDNHSPDLNHWRVDNFSERWRTEPNAEQLIESLNIVWLQAEQDFIPKDSASVRTDIYNTVLRLKKIDFQKQVQNLERQIRDAERAVPRDQKHLEDLVRTFQQVSYELHKLNNI